MDPVVVVRRLESPDWIIRGRKLGRVDDIAEVSAIDPVLANGNNSGGERS
jgi:hypothetical protein